MSEFNPMDKCLCLPKDHKFVSKAFKVKRVKWFKKRLKIDFPFFADGKIFVLAK